MFGFSLWDFRVFICHSLCRFSQNRNISHPHPTFNSAGRSFQGTLDNILPVLAGHRRGVSLGSGIFGLASVEAKALRSWGGGTAASSRFRYVVNSVCTSGDSSSPKVPVGLKIRDPWMGEMVVLEPQYFALFMRKKLCLR